MRKYLWSVEHIERIQAESDIAKILDDDTKCFFSLKN